MGMQSGKNQKVREYTEKGCHYMPGKKKNRELTTSTEFKLSTVFEYWYMATNNKKIFIRNSGKCEHWLFYNISELLSLRRFSFL